MKKYLTVGYAYPVYFLLILGQYFLAEGLDSLYDPPAGLSAVVQPAQHLPVAAGIAPGTDEEARTAFAGAGEASGKGR
ncbi:MAG: hypothetical protein ICV83_22535 [Cytophagales bacterium]|nr:hypothetical protein [Cytophagales bacterium]